MARKSEVEVSESASAKVGDKRGDWSLELRQEQVDDWWLRSLVRGDQVNSFETEEDAARAADKDEKPLFRRKLKPVWVWVHGPTGHVHTAEVQRKDPTPEQEEKGEKGTPVLDEHNRPIPLDPPLDIIPRGTADITVTPPGERERIQTQLDQLAARLAELEG